MSEATTPASTAGLIGLERHLLDRVEAAVMAVDLHGRILFANRYVEQLFGWSAEELVGRDSGEFSGVAVSTELAREIYRALEAHASWEGTFEVRRKDGSLVSVHAIDSPLYDANGEVAGVVSLGIDASRERAVESLLREQATFATVFRQLGDVLLEELDLAKLLEAVTDIAAEAIGADLGAFVLDDLGTGDGGALVVTSSGAADDLVAAMPMPVPRAGADEPLFFGDDVVRVDDAGAAGAALVDAPGGEGQATVRSYLAAPVRSRTGEILGGLFLGHREAARFLSADADLLGAITAQAGIAIDNLHVHRSLEQEVARRRHAQEVEHFLARCTMVLSASLDYEQNFAALATMAVPFLADVCLIDVADDDGIRRMAAAHADPAMQELMDELVRNYPPDPGGQHPAVRTLRTGQTSYAEDMSDEFLRATTRDARHYEITKSLGFASYVSVPLNARGHTVGSFTLVSCHAEHRFSDRDVAVASEVANHAAIALDNARLYDAQQKARAEAEAIADRLGQLQRLSMELSRAVSVTEVARVIRAVSMTGLETDARGLWLLDEPGQVLRLVPGSQPGAVAPKFDTIPLRAPLPAPEVVRTARPVFIRSEAERDARYPALAEAPMASASFAVLPLQAEQRVIGVLAVAYTRPRAFDDGDSRYLQAVAQQCGQALSRAVLYDRERLGRDRAETDRRRIQELNRALQTSLLPPSLPDIPGVELDARYHPALAGMEVGGDFYDVFDTGGDWAAVVGDVCGKGPEAAAVTATARWTIRSVAMDVRQPAQVLRKVNDTMLHQQLDDRFCTAVYARVVPTAQGVRLSVCRGGHPAPIVLRADGTVESMGTAGSLIGILPDVRLWEETTQLDPGDAYVAFTDGVTEARRGRDQFGENRLFETLRGVAGRDAEAIGEAIERAVLDFGGPEPSDDFAILVLRVPPG